jgi:hypothetical protein
VEEIGMMKYILANGGSIEIKTHIGVDSEIGSTREM